MFCVLFVLYKINSKNKFIHFLTKFNKNDFISAHKLFAKKQWKGLGAIRIF